MILMKRDAQRKQPCTHVRLFSLTKQLISMGSGQQHLPTHLQHGRSGAVWGQAGSSVRVLPGSSHSCPQELTGKKRLSSFFGQKVLVHQPAHRALPRVTATPHSNLSTAEGLSPKIPPSSPLHKFAFWLWPVLQKCLFALRHNCSSSMSSCEPHHIPQRWDRRTDIGQEKLPGGPQVKWSTNC